MKRDAVYAMLFVPVLFMTWCIIKNADEVVQRLQHSWGGSTHGNDCDYPVHTNASASEYPPVSDYPVHTNASASEYLPASEYPPAPASAVELARGLVGALNENTDENLS